MFARTDIEAELICAQQISGQLKEARQARGLSQKEAAYQLMLSADQINCLESQSLKSFYGPQYYLLAARKYAAFLGVKISRPQPPEVISPAPPFPEQAQLLKGHFLVGRPLLWAFAALAIVLVGLAFVVREGGHERDAPLVVSPSPAVPAEAVTPAVPPQNFNVKPAPGAAPQTVNSRPPATPPVAPLTSPAKSGTVELQLNFSAATWVSVYRRDGSHEQKVYGPEETLKLDAAPLTELIIGNAPATRLSVGKSEISLMRFTNQDSNVARIVGQGLRDLGTAHP